MADELIDICDEDNNITGIKQMKSVAHKMGLWHRAATIWVYNSKGEILLQLRAKDKNLFPNLWDISVAGHVGAGEKPIFAAAREIEEEIGLKAEKNDLVFYKILKHGTDFKEIKNREFYYIYFLKFDGNIDELKLQEEEVQKIRFFTQEELEEELETNPDDFVPHGKFWFEIMNEIKKIHHKKI